MWWFVWLTSLAPIAVKYPLHHLEKMNFDRVLGRSQWMKLLASMLVPCWFVFVSASGLIMGQSGR